MSDKMEAMKNRAKKRRSVQEAAMYPDGIPETNIYDNNMKSNDDSNNTPNVDIENKDDIASNIDRNKNGKNAIGDLLEYGMPKNVYRGFYLEKELDDILEGLPHSRKKGFKSKFINELLKKEFKELGLLK